MANKYLATCQTIKNEAGNKQISFWVTREQSFELYNLARGTFKRPVELSCSTETVSWCPPGLNYYDQLTPGAARGSMMDRQSVISEMERIHEDSRNENDCDGED